MINDNSFQKFFGIMEQFHNDIEQKMQTQLKGDFEDMTILQCKACMIIDKQEPIRMSDFAKIMNLKTSGATQLIDKMKEFGLVKREYDSKDRRIIMVSLEKNMKTKMKKMKKIEHDILKESFDKLDPQEFETLTNLIQKLI